MELSFRDKTLQCRDCGTEFVWTAGEQQFYAARNLTNQPGRCQPCRATARAARHDGGIASRERPREYFPAICTQCGVQTQVPFLPRTDKPVYCSACFDTVRLEHGSVEPARF